MATPTTIQVFCDFDGTICLADTGCILIDSGMGYDNRKKLDAKILSHEMTFLQGMDLFWDAVDLTWEEGMDMLKDTKLDPGYVRFHHYVFDHQIPYAIVSCGLDILIQEYMSSRLGAAEASKLVILANYGKVVDKKWLVTYRDDSPHSHDKSICIKEAKAEFAAKKATGLYGDDKEQVVVFCGDGISDLSAAREADVLFARKGRDLEKYCWQHKIPFFSFETFDEVTNLLVALENGSMSKSGVRALQEAHLLDQKKEQ